MNQMPSSPPPLTVLLFILILILLLLLLCFISQMLAPWPHVTWSVTCEKLTKLPAIFSHSLCHWFIHLNVTTTDWLAESAIEHSSVTHCESDRVASSSSSTLLCHLIWILRRSLTHFPCSLCVQPNLLSQESYELRVTSYEVPSTKYDLTSPSWTWKGQESDFLFLLYPHFCPLFALL